MECKMTSPKPPVLCHSPLPSPLNIDDSAEFLDAIEEQISLLDGVLVLLILAIGAIRLYDAIHFVDLRVKSTSGDEPETIIGLIFKFMDI